MRTLSVRRPNPRQVRSVPTRGLSPPGGAAMSTTGLPRRRANRPATMPTIPGGQVGWLRTSTLWSAQGRIALNLRQGGVGDLLGQPLPPAIQPLGLGRQAAGTDPVGHSQQFHAVRGIGQPPQGIEPWTQHKADVLFGDALRPEFRCLVDGLEAQPLRLAQRFSALAGRGTGRRRSRSPHRPQCQARQGPTRCPAASGLSARASS